jgi:iron complex outermembrane receptor protein
MKLSKLTTAIVVALNSTACLANEESTILDDIFVSENLIVTDNLQTAYSTETYSRKDIQESGTNSLSDFLNQYTTISIQPNYGNPLSPLLDMNGYGTASGYENIQIIVDGVSINNIDLVPQQLSSVALESIENINILRGSGSVLYGNGANAGAIVITTNRGFSADDNASISTSYGSNQTSQQSINLNKIINVDSFQILGALSAESLHSNGSKKVTSDGTRNSLDNTNLSGTVGIKKNHTSALITIAKNNSSVNYPGSMSIEDFNKNPDADVTNGVEQTYEVISKKLALSTKISENTRIDYTLNKLNKNSTSITYNSKSDYDVTEHHLSLKTILDSSVFQYGLEKKSSTIEGTYGDKARDEIAGFISANFDINDRILINTGYRKHNFEYPDNSKANDDLNAYNLGINYLLDNSSAIFSNINHAFLVPNFDRLFTSSGYNDGIKPQESNTFTLGYKLKQIDFSAKAELFYSDLENEIYYNNATSQNTNLDKSHKKGLNLAFQQSSNNLKTGIDYSYVQAIIDNEAGQNYSGKLLPGTPEHTIKLFAQYDFASSMFSSLPKQSIKVNHKQTSDSYMMDDFENVGAKAPGYRSTDISYKLSNKKLSIQLGINNILDENNGLYLYRTSGDKVYPTNYERYYYVSANYQF